MLNYRVDPATLRALVPRGTELDDFRGDHFVSVVGFLFLGTKVRGVPVPFHRDFEEVNLRFYVRREARDELRRGVAFVKELVPRRAIAWLARRSLQRELRSLCRCGIASLPPTRLLAPIRSAMRGSSERIGTRSRSRRRHSQRRPRPTRRSASSPSILGYARQRDGGTVEYQVEHPPWSVSHAIRASLEANVEQLYGTAFAPLLQGAPASAFLADGSAVAVHQGRRVA